MRIKLSRKCIWRLQEIQLLTQAIRLEFQARIGLEKYLSSHTL